MGLGTSLLDNYISSLLREMSSLSTNHSLFSVALVVVHCFIEATLECSC